MISVFSKITGQFLTNKTNLWLHFIQAKYDLMLTMSLQMDCCKAA